MGPEAGDKNVVGDLPVLRGSEMDTDIVIGPEKSPTRVILKPGLWRQRRVPPGHSRQTQNESFLATLLF